MILIGVTGGTGSGKSTLCKMLAKKIPRSVIIDGDKLSNDTLRFYADELFLMFGEKIRPDGEGRLKLRFFMKHPARIKEAIAIAKQYLDGAIPAVPNGGGGDESLAAAVAMARSYMNRSIHEMLNRLSSDTPAVIIDWANLPALDVWKSCELKIIVSADDAARLLRLKNRKKSIRFTEKELRVMVESASLPYDEIDCDLRLCNDRLETLDDAANEILLHRLNNAHKEMMNFVAEQG